MSAPMPASTCEWTKEPYVLGIHDVARILRVSVTTIRRELAAGTFWPQPLPRAGRTSAYRWSRQALEQALDPRHYPRHDSTPRRRFFAKAVKARPSAA